MLGSEYKGFSVTHFHPDNMSKMQREFLLNLNDRLYALEKMIRHEALELNDCLQRRISNTEDWLQDYEIELRLFIYRSEADPRYRADGDNILGVYRQRLDNLENNVEFHNLCSCLNFNDIGLKDLRDPDHMEFHCYLYHNLYSNAVPRWDDMLRIGKISLEINVNHIYAL